MSLLYIYSDIFLQHKTGNHPETEKRLEWINLAIDNYHIGDKLTKMMPRKASVDEILSVHSQDHINEIERTIAKGEKYLDPDTVVSKESLKAAYYSAGAGLTAADEIMNGNFKAAFCAARPPGHHALSDHSMGFCIFNNVAITTRYLQNTYNLKKILILDWDVHHGNGTEHIFYEDDSVFYISIHQYPYYPGTGAKEDTGKGKGEGFNLNLPMMSGAGDKEYFEAFNNTIIPAIRNFAPDFILISAGFDAHERDAYSSINLSSKSYGDFTKMVKDASTSAKGRILSYLEGGYNPIGLCEGVLHHLEELL